MKLKKALCALLTAIVALSIAAVPAAALTANGTGSQIIREGKLAWTNVTNYSFSSEYMSSRWYQNFTKLEIGDNERNNVLSIAISQLGYHEGDSTADFNGANTAGSTNYTEYSRLPQTSLGGTGIDYKDYAWCACFVNWCLNQAGITHAGAELGCWRWIYAFLKPNDLWQDSPAYGGSYTPKPGDMIFFNWSGNNNNSGHIGFVLYTDSTYVYTIEGNADNNVTVRRYFLTSNQVIGYGTPRYNEGTTPTFDYSYSGGMPTGSYVAMVPAYRSTGQTTVPLKIATADGNNITERIPIGSLVELIGQEGHYAKVLYNGKEGYINPLFLNFMMASPPAVSTLRYDANGGENAPAQQSFQAGDTVTISDTVPTRMGYTFLGWGMSESDTTPALLPGHQTVLNTSTTLYAVWQKGNGVPAAPFADRPIINSASLSVGNIQDLSVFDDTDGDTRIGIREDDSMGKVLALTSTKASDDVFTTLFYADLCQDLNLKPTSADQVDYLILLVKKLSATGNDFTIYYDCGGAVKAVSSPLADTTDWQYVVFDMTDTAGWEGSIRALRLDWQSSAEAAGETLLLANISFAADDDVRDAILAGEDVFPEATPAETTAPAGNVTHATTSGEDLTGSGTGCGSRISASPALVVVSLMAAGMVISRKKKEN